MHGSYLIVIVILIWRTQLNYRLFTALVRMYWLINSVVSSMISLYFWDDDEAYEFANVLYWSRFLNALVHKAATVLYKIVPMESLALVTYNSWRQADSDVTREGRHGFARFMTSHNTGARNCDVTRKWRIKFIAKSIFRCFILNHRALIYEFYC